MAPSIEKYVDEVAFLGTPEMIGLSQHHRRILMAGSSAMVLLGASRFGPSTIDWYLSTRTSADSLIAAVAREEASIRALPMTRDSLVARKVRLASLDSAILEGKTPALAGATLSEVISDYAEESKAQVGNVQLRIDSAAATAAFVKVGAHASVKGDLAAIVRFLARVESGPTLLAVRELEMISEGDPSASHNSTESLRADVMIEGLARNPSFGVVPR